VRLVLAHPGLVQLVARHAVRVAAPLELGEAGQLVGFGRDDQLAGDLARQVVRAAEGDGLRTAGTARRAL
jgi:hypothetical protein